MDAGEKIQIIGVGDDGTAGLTAAGRRLIAEAELLVGAEAALAAVDDAPGRRLAIGRDLDAAATAIASAKEKKIVVLASGDPLFYGVARYLCDRLGKDRFEVVPHVSTMQLAFARVKESWDEAFLTDLANHPLDYVLEKLRTADKAGLFTTEEAPPGVVAAALVAGGVDYFTVYVCENLGGRDERVSQGTLAEIAELTFNPLNVMILIRREASPDLPTESAPRRLFGNQDDAFVHSRPKQGLITPAEIRSLALAQLGVERDSVVWDVGAGSGAVAIEAARLAADGQVFAIEMDPDDHALIRENCRRFGVENVRPILGKAPDAWRDLPNPDCVFIGGQGREALALVHAAFDRAPAGARLAVVVTSIENLSAVHADLRGLGADSNVLMINIARGAEQLERVRFVALNPAFLLSATKPRR